MSMKYKLDKDGYEALDSEQQALYKAKGDDYVLNVDGLPKEEDTSGMKRKMDKLLKEKKDLEAEQAQKTAEAVEAALADAKESGDTAALETSWQKKYDTKVNSLQATIDGLTNTVAELTSGSEATKMAGSIALNGSADVLLPHIQKRLRTEMKDGKPVTVVLDGEGKASAMTLAELADEFKANESFAPLIVGTKAKGKGVHQQTEHQQVGPSDKQTKLSPEERMTNARASQ